jgi:hypothetical protein
MRWEALDSLLTWDDDRYLDDHPPEYVNSYVDSELYFLYLLKVVHQGQGTIEESLVRAVWDVAVATNQVRRLNFVLTAGDTLYAVRYAPNDSADAVVYSPITGPGQSSTWYAVGSQIVGSSLSGWAQIPERSLGVFVPGAAPRFLPIPHPAALRRCCRRPASPAWFVPFGRSGPSPMREL